MTRQIVKSVILNVVTLAILLLGAGRVDWIAAWIFVAMMWCAQMAVVLLVYRKSPDLMQERSKIQPGTKRWDRFIVAGAAGIAPLLMFALAALDARFGWSAAMPPALTVGGFVVCAAGALLTLVAMMANRFFATTVRIQKDRGHTVVDVGPYSHVRHPGYTGMIAFDLAAPVALGSWWALIPAGMAIVLFLARTVLEDRTLRAELPGYGEYAGRVRQRLIPGVW